jgi:FkbM family methyltransferase
MTFYGQFNPPVDAFIFNRYFPNRNFKGTFIECGAFDGVTISSCKFFEESLRWNGYNLEPVPIIFEKLCTNRPSSNNFNIGLSNFIGTATFTEAEHPEVGFNFGNGSLAHVDSHKAYLKDLGCIFHKMEVSLTTWKEFIKDQLIKQVDLFVLDVEGHELSVIDGMLDSDVLPTVLCVEVGHIDVNIIKSKLEPLGYIYDTSSHVNAFFIKENMKTSFMLRRAFYGPINLFHRAIRKLSRMLKKIQ